MSSNRVIRTSKDETSRSANCSNSGNQSRHLARKVQEYLIKVPEDKRLCSISGCCIMPENFLLFTDYANQRLKRMELKSGKVSYIDIKDNLSDVCLTEDGGNKAAVCGTKTLYFVNVKARMMVVRDVGLSHNCNGMAYHNGCLYITDDTSVFIYSTKGEKIRTLYTVSTRKVKFCHLTLNFDGSKVFVADENSGIEVIDKTGKQLVKFSDPELGEPQGVCLDSTGNVLASGFLSDSVLKLDCSGSTKLGTIIEDTGEISDPKCLCISKSILYVGQWNDKLTAFQL